LHMVKPDGHGLEVQLLRPIDWLVETGAAAGGTIRLQIDELGIDGPATVLSIDDCPAIRPGPGHVVTGTFAHDPSDNLINVQVEGEPEPIGCTPNHPFWSETREDFVQAIDLEPGEELWTSEYGIVEVQSITARPQPERVYNLEVQTEHVYQVGESGVLVHNAKSYLNNISPKNWKRIFGKLRRPYLRNKTRAAIDASARKNPAGQFVDSKGNALTNRDYGHIRGHENRRILAAGEELGLSQRQLNDYVNDRPQFFRIEDAARNQSHVDELPGTDQLGPILKDMRNYFGL